MVVALQMILSVLTLGTFVHDNFPSLFIGVTDVVQLASVNDLCEIVNYVKICQEVHNMPMELKNLEVGTILPSTLSIPK